MKKLVSLLLAVCLCFSVASILTACGHEHTLTKVEAVAETCETTGNSEYYTCACGKYFSDEEAKTEIDKDSWIISATGHSFSAVWTYNETHHWKVATCAHTTEKGEYAEHSLTNNECACGYLAITYTVADSDEWNEVFTGEYLTNGTVIVDGNWYQNNVIMPDVANRVVMKSNDTAMVMITTAEGQTESQYLVKSGEKWYGLSEIQGAWYGAEMPATIVESYTFAGSQGIAFVDKFSSLEYDDENHCYLAENFVLDEEHEIVADYVKIFIENGKLVSMEMKTPYDATTYIITSYAFSNYGTTVIDDIPEWTPAPQQ